MTNASLSVLERKLDDLIAKRSLVEIYRDRLASEPFVGRLSRRSPYAFLVEKVDAEYRPDGFAVARIGDITRVKTGGRELEAGAILAETRHESPEFAEVMLLEISAAMTILQREFGHVSLYVEGLNRGVCFIGEVTEMDDDYVLLHQFGTMKSMDRSELLLRLDEISRVEANGVYERQLSRLFGRSQP